MARLFTSASSEKITLSLGALGFAFGPGTIAAVIRLTSTGAQRDIFMVGAATTAQYGIGVSSTGVPQAFFDNTGPTVGSALSTGQWYLLAFTKDTGSVKARLHLFDYSANAWTHTDSGSSFANSSVPITRAAFATNAAGTGAFLDGDIAVAAVWNVVLTDSQSESLATDLGQSNWVNASGSSSACKALWRLVDPVATSLLDRTGGAANQSAITGTTLTVNDHPLLNRSIAHAPSPAWAA